MNRTGIDAGKRRLQRSADLLRDYLKGLDSEHADLVAHRDYLQAKIDLVERQRANLQEVIDIEGKLAELDQQKPGASETTPEGSSQEGEVVTAP